MPPLATARPAPESSDEGPSANPADPEPHQPSGPHADPDADRATRIEILDPDALLDGAARAWLRAHAEAAIARLRPEVERASRPFSESVERASRPFSRSRAGGEIRARLIGDAEMAELHGRHMADATTTDVLTFDHAPDAAAPLDVDLALCVDEARRQADARGGPVERELLLYFIHGALHCMGYDDADEASAAAIHAREDETLTAIGVGPVYAKNPPARGDQS